MFYWLWNKIKFLMPYGLLINIYKNKKALPISFETNSGNIYKCILLDFNYGIIYNSNKYDENRLNTLLNTQRILSQKSNEIMNEINELSFDTRERLIDMKEDLNEET